MPKQSQQTNMIKSIILISLLTGVFVISGVVISAYPQHLWVNNQTVVDATVGNFNNSSVNIRGNQVQYSSGDVIFLEGRDYIRITGNQKQIGSDTFIGAIRTVSASIEQNILFQQKVGSFPINNSAGKLIIDDVIITIVPITNTIVNIKTSDSDYNVQFVANTVYITSKSIMLKLIENNGNIEIYLIGTSGYNKILFIKI